MKPFLLSLSDPRNKAWFRFLEILREAKNDPEIATNPVTVGVIEILEVLVEEAHEHSTADDFWKLVKKAVRTEHARAIATKKNAGLRQWVLAEWSQRVDHGQSKESFARSILPLLKKQFPQNQALKTLKATTIAHDWLPATKK